MGIPNWTPRPHPLSNSQYHKLQGQYCRLELLNSKTDENAIQQLYDSFKPNEDIHFKYMGFGPFKTVDEFKQQVVYHFENPIHNVVFYTVFVDDKPVGFLSLLRIFPDLGTIEVGYINYSLQLVQTRAATEAIYLLLEYAFDILGYRRFEWKCDALNAKSRRAALRYGFQYEGTWLKAGMYKGRSRDTAWFSIIDVEWIEMKQEYQRWLNPNNFDSNQQQLTKLNAAQYNPRKVKLIEVNQ